MKYIRILITITIIFPLLVIAPNVSAQSPCGDSYVVQPGDTLSGIAVFCETSVAAILEANPGITDPTRLFVGQRLNMPPPEEEEEQPTVTLTPACGPAGSEVLLEGRAYPANAIIDVEIGEQTAPAAEFELIERLRANANGRFELQETIPRTAQPGESWIMFVIARAGGPRIEAASNPFFVTESATRGESTTYIVQPGDTLRSLAARFDVTISALLAANPEITDPSLISVGQRLIIPARAQGDPAVEISPTCGPAGSEVTVLVSDFPENARVEVSLGVFRTTPEIIARDITDGQGELEIEATIPNSAQRNQPWLVTVETVDLPRIRASSSIFTVTQTRTPQTTTTYTVQAGDMLIDVATRFGISTQALLTANPEITNPNTLIVGQRLRIPAQEVSVTIAPRVGTPGTNLQVEAANFPGNTEVEIGAGRSSTDFEIVDAGVTDAVGDLRTQIAIPEIARPNERWLVVAVARLGRLEIKAVSDFFTVIGEAAEAQQIVTIWPLQGPPGSTVVVVAAGFPRYDPVEIKLGRMGESPEVVESTVTDINGTLSSEVTIPDEAEVNEDWVVVITTTRAPSMEATSPSFVITR